MAFRFSIFLLYVCNQHQSPCPCVLPPQEPTLHPSFSSFSTLIALTESGRTFSLPLCTSQSFIVPVEEKLSWVFFLILLLTLVAILLLLQDIIEVISLMNYVIGDFTWPFTTVTLIVSVYFPSMSSFLPCLF